jgi:hypothetical protein
VVGYFREFLIGTEADKKLRFLKVMYQCGQKKLGWTTFWAIKKPHMSDTEFVAANGALRFSIYSKALKESKWFLFNNNSWPPRG